MPSEIVCEIFKSVYLISKLQKSSEICCVKVYGIMLDYSVISGKCVQDFN